MALTPDKVREEYGLKICEKIIPDNAVFPRNTNVGGYTYKAGSQFKANKTLVDGKPSKITIHNTQDLDGVNDDAEQYTRATYPNGNMLDVRVHYYVDDLGAWQNLKENEVGWHAGNAVGNNTSIAIEIIMKGNNGKEDKIAEDKGALLAAILVVRHGLDIGDVVPHKYWSGKQCPLYILPHWDSFIDRVKYYIDKVRGTDNVVDRTYLKINKTFNDGKWNTDQKCAVEYGTNGTQKDKALEEIIRQYKMMNLNESEYFVFDPNGNVLYPVADDRDMIIKSLRADIKLLQSKIDQITGENVELKNHKSMVCADIAALYEKYKN